MIETGIFFAIIGCVLGRFHRAVIPMSRSGRATNLLDLVHTDFLFPVEVTSAGFGRHLITFIDEYSDGVAEFTMKAKY